MTETPAVQGPYSYNTFACKHRRAGNRIDAKHPRPLTGVGNVRYNEKTLVGETDVFGVVLENVPARHARSRVTSRSGALIW
jgi:hypothetical protein